MNDQSGTAQLRFLEETAIRNRSKITTCPSAGKKGASAAFPARAACCTGRSVSTASGRRMRCKP